VCTIVNVRRGVSPGPGPDPIPPPTPNPVPPPPPPPDPTPLPPPAPGTADLELQKFVDREVGSLGDIVTWGIVVTNHGPETATGVRIADAAAAGATFVSLSVSQGTCGKTTCSLGTIAPGGTVRIVARTRALTVGARLNTAIVAGDQPDSNPQNNVGSALVRVLAAFRPPLVERCGGLSVNRRVAVAGTPLRVRARVTNVFGRPLDGTPVRAQGAGVLTAARTNALGVATLRFVPARAGAVRFTVGARTLNAAGAARCRALLGVRTRKAPPPGRGQKPSGPGKPQFTG
jgi:uncharacterized repeat protein (TIGR01451 family)